MAESREVVRRVDENIADPSDDDFRARDLMSECMRVVAGTSLLENVPLTIQILGKVLSFATGEDFLLSVKAGQDIKPLKHHSFRGCIVQLTNAVYDAFMQADRNMDRITMITMLLPEKFDLIMELIFEGEQQDIEDYLPETIEEIKASSQECEKLSRDVQVAFDEVWNILTQLLEFSTVSKSEIEDKNKEVEKLKITASEELAAVKDIQQKVEKKYETSQTSAEKQQQAVDKSIADLPSGVGGTVVNILTLGTYKRNKMTKLEEEKQRFQEEKEALAQAEKEWQEQREKMAELQAAIATLDVTKIDFDNINKYLHTALGLLFQVKDKWAAITRYFQKMSNFMDKTFAKQIDGISKFAGKANRGAVTKLTQKQMGTAYVNAGITAHAFNIATGHYRDISSKYFLPQLGTVHALLALDHNRPEDKKKMEDKDKEIKRQTKETIDAITDKKGIAKEMQQRKKELEKKWELAKNLAVDTNMK